MASRASSPSATWRCWCPCLSDSVGLLTSPSRSPVFHSARSTARVVLLPGPPEVFPGHQDLRQQGQSERPGALFTLVLTHRGGGGPPPHPP